VEVTLLAEQFLDAQSSFKQIRLAAFFRSDLLAWPRRVWEVLKVCRLAVTMRGVIIIVQGDLPRLTYLLLQILVPLIFIRQDGILTCPGNTRFLAQSRAVCDRRMGLSCLSCLAVHRVERCMQGLSLCKRIGRVVFRIRDRLLLRCIDHFVTSSRYLARAHDRQARVVYPPVLTRREKVAEVARDLKRLIFCGRLEQVKGAAEAIGVLRLLPERYHLEILGEGPDREGLSKLVEELGLHSRVTFLGWLDGPDRDRALASAGVLLMPSLWDEAFGMAGVEAMSLGTPVVAYEVGGVSEWCRGQAGVLVPCGDIAGAAMAVRELTQNRARWARYSQAAVRLVEQKFPAERFGREVGEMVGEVTTSKYAKCAKEDFEL
jgi:glycosyltransferase involved in cell wall biosynthesis